MNLKNIGKRAVLLCLTMVLSVGGLSGCGNNKKIIFTTGLSGNQVFKIGSLDCTMPETMIYLVTFYNQYVNTYGHEMWNYDFGEVSLEDHVKDVVLSKMAQIKIMNLMAEDRDIVLNHEEKQKVHQAAENYFSLLSEELKKQEHITQELVEQVYTEYTLANKVYTYITEAADMEISDDEARTVTVLQLELKNKEQGEQALERIKAGESFEAAGADGKQTIQNYARGSIESSFEEIVFSLDEGEISDVIETADGCCIVKCMSTMDFEATQENKLVLAEKRKKEAFSKAYQEIAQNTHSQFQDKLWEKLALDGDIYYTDANFFDIYDAYVKE